jgi:hypothetical protein
MKTETLRGAALVHKIRELEAKNIVVRSITVGGTTSEWIIEHDDPCHQADLLAETLPEASHPETLAGSNRSGHDGGHNPGSHSPGASHLPGREGAA